LVKGLPRCTSVNSGGLFERNGDGIVVPFHLPNTER